MANRRPLVIVSGALQELPSGDNLPPSIVHQVGYASAQYYYPCSQHAQSTSNTLGNNSLRLVPWLVVESVTIVRIGGDVSAAGQAGSTLRIGIYNDTGSGYPGTLLLEAGTISTASATVQELTINQSLSPGIYWIGGAVQGAATTQPTVRVTSNWNPPIPLRADDALPSAASTVVGFSQSSVTGALPSTFTATPNSVGNAPRLFVKTA